MIVGVVSVHFLALDLALPLPSDAARADALDVGHVQRLAGRVEHQSARIPTGGKTSQQAAARRIERHDGHRVVRAVGHVQRLAVGARGKRDRRAAEEHVFARARGDRFDHFAPADVDHRHGVAVGIGHQHVRAVGRGKDGRRVQADHDFALLLAGGQIDDRDAAVVGDKADRIDADRLSGSRGAGNRVGIGQPAAPIGHVGLFAHQRHAKRRVADRDLAPQRAGRQVDFGQRVAQVQDGPQRLALHVDRQPDRHDQAGPRAGGFGQLDVPLRFEPAFGRDVEDADRAAHARGEQSLAVGREDQPGVAAFLERGARHDAGRLGIDRQHGGPIEHRQVAAIGAQGQIDRPPVVGDLAAQRREHLVGGHDDPIRIGIADLRPVVRFGVWGDGLLREGEIGGGQQQGQGGDPVKGHFAPYGLRKLDERRQRAVRCRPQCTVPMCSIQALGCPKKKGRAAVAARPRMDAV